MYRKPLFCVLRYLPLLTLLLHVGGLKADEPKPTSLIPQDAVLVVELTDPGQLLDRLLGDRVINAVKALPQYDEAIASKDIQQVLNLVKYLEGKFDTDWKDLLGRLIGGGVTWAMTPDESHLLIVDAEDPEVLKEIHELVLFYSRSDATNAGDPDRVVSADYRGVTGWSLGPNESHAVIGNRLLLTNKPEMLKKVIDLRADNAGSLASLESYKKSKQALGADTAASAYVNWELLKQVPGLKAGLQQNQNPLVALLIAPLTESLLESTWMAAGIGVQEDTLSVQITADGIARGDQTAASFGTPPDGAGVLPSPGVPGEIASLSLYRDLHAFYAAKDDLFPERTSELIFFENMMGIFFTGRDLTEEVLAHTYPETRIVVATQKWDPEIGTPAMQLPAFAAVFHLRDPEKFQPIIEEAWQKAVGLINFTRGQQALPGLIIDRPTHAGIKFTVGYFSAAEEEDREALDVRFNFRPALAVVDDYLILSSTEQLTRDLIDSLQGSAEKPLPGVHSVVEIDGRGVTEALRANRESLVQQNMVEEGSSREKAESDIDMLLTIAQTVDSLKLIVGSRDGVTRARLDLTVDLPENLLDLIPKN